MGLSFEEIRGKVIGGGTQPSDNLTFKGIASSDTQSLGEPDTFQALRDKVMRNAKAKREYISGQLGSVEGVTGSAAAKPTSGGRTGATSSGTAVSVASSAEPLKTAAKGESEGGLLPSSFRTGPITSKTEVDRFVQNLQAERASGLSDTDALNAAVDHVYRLYGVDTQGERSLNVLPAAGAQLLEDLVDRLGLSEAARSQAGIGSPYYGGVNSTGKGDYPFIRPWDERTTSEESRAFQEQERAEEFVGDVTPGKAALLGVGSGMNRVSTGLEQLKNILQGDLDPVQKNSMEYIGDVVNEKGSGLEKGLFSLTDNITAMAPSMLAGGPAGVMLTGLTSGANSYRGSRLEGYDAGESLLYGVVNGALESALQYALGGLKGLGKGGFSKALAKTPLKDTLSRATAKVIKSVPMQNFLKSAASYGGSMLDEGFEEYVQALLDPVVRNVILNEQNSFEPFSEDKLYAAMMGALTAGLMNAPSNLAQYTQNRRAGNRILQNGETDIALNQAAEIADPDTQLSRNIEYLRGRQESGKSVSPALLGKTMESASKLAAEKSTTAYVARSTGQALGIDENIIKTAEKLAENTGRRIEFVETLGGIDGMYDASTGTLTVAADTPYPIRAILKHELTHSLEGTKAYAELSDFVLREFIETDAVKSGLSLDAVVDAKIAQYADAGKTLSRDDAMRELVADYCASKLFTNDAAIRRLSAEKPGVARRILNWIRSLKTKIAGTAEEKTLARAEELYHKALMEPFSKGEGVHYSLAGTNRNGIEVYETSPEIKSLSYRERMKKFLDIMEGQYKGRTAKFIRNGHPYYARFENADVRKNIYGDKRSDSKGQRAKINVGADGNIFELVENAQYNGSRPETGKVSPAHQGVTHWDYFIKSVQIDGVVYDMVANVRKKTDGSYVYSIQLNENKKIEAAPPLSNNVALNRAFTTSTNPSVSQNADGVNTSISKNTGDDTQAALGYMGEDTAAALKQMVEKYGKRADNPVEIGRLTPQDADTTPPVAGGQRDTGNGYTVPAEPAPRGNSESHFTENVGNSSIFDDRFKKLSLEDAGIHTYDSITNKETLNAANKKLNDGGYRAVSDWFAKPVSQATPEDIATGIILLSRYQLAGDYEGMVNAARRLRKMGTAAGQTVQEFAILSRMTPEGMAYYAQKSLDEAFETMVKNRSQSWVDKNADKYRLTDEDIRFIMDKTAKASKLPAGRDKNILLGEIAGRIQDKIPPEKGQNIRALARISMLLNPKTNVRNVLGNASITPVSWLDDLIGTAVDKAVARKTGQRTTGLFDLKSFKGLGKGVYESFDDFRRGINTRDIDADRFEIGRGGKSFNEHHSGAAGVLNPMSKALNALDRTTSFLLEAGDRGFFEMWFMNSLKNQMKLNGVKTPTAEMVEVARQDALSRTWQDTNGYTKFVSGVKKALNSVQVGGYGLGDVFIKFTKTPANLTKALVDYSPVGLTKAIAADGRRFYQAATRGEATPQLQRRFVNSLSKGITGTLLMLLFAALANRDILQGKGDADSDVAEFEKNILGIQPYSVKIGDKSYSYEWMQPIGGSAAIVADIVGQMKGEKPKQYFKGGTQAEEAANAILSAIQSGGQVLYDQSFMQSLANLFEADSLVQGLLDGILAEPSVFVPQIVSQTSQLFDDTARRSYVSGRPLETAENKILARTPWRTQLEPVVDTLGREVAGNNNMWDAYFNPANTYTANPTPAAEEMYRVYQKTGDKRVIPPKAPNSISVSVDGGQQTVSLTAEQKTAYQKTTGSIASREVSHLLRSSQYRKLSETEKADVLADIYTYANAVAKSEVSEYALTGANAKIAQAENAGISVADYLIFSLSKDADGNGTVSQKEMRQALDASDFTTGQKSVLWQLQNAGWKTNPYNSAYLETDIDKLLKGALS